MSFPSANLNVVAGFGTLHTMDKMTNRIGRAAAVLSLALLSGPSFMQAEARIPELPTGAALAVSEPAAALEARTPSFDLDTAATSGAAADVLQLALSAVSCAVTSGAIAPPPTLTVIDYSRPSTEPRLWVFDMNTGTMLYKELVAHGRNTGENMSLHFSDRMNSHQSSIGLFVTGDTYVGSNGYSLRMDGLEPGFNATARERAIVMHGAPYVSEDIATRQGRLGRSWGCPALRAAAARDVIDTVRGGGVIFSYYPDQAWLKSSRFLNGCSTRAASASPQPPRA
jgi:hypothetical protein